MSETEARPTTTPPPRKPRRWRFPVFLGALLLLIVVGVPLGLYLYYRAAADGALAEALAEADRLDPGWRLEELEARREKIPDRENSALQIRAVKKRMPPNWGGDPQFSELFEQEVPEAQLNEAQVKALRAELGKAAAALAEARKLKDLPRGRFPINYTPDGLSTFLNSQEARDAARLLSNDVRLLAQEGKADAALDSCRAVLNCARAVGDEPTLISVLIRVALRGIAVGDTERVLAQGEPAAPGLLTMQRVLEEEETVPLMLTGLRGHRAFLDRLWNGLQSGEIKHQVIAHPVNGPKVTRERLLGISTIGIKHARAATLRYLTEVVEVSKVPVGIRAMELMELEASARSLPEGAKLLIPAFARVASAEQRSVAQLRCAIVALAAERHRRERGAWPAKGADLVGKGLLKAWPEDPYDGALLRFKRLADSVVIYSIGPDGKDDGGHINRENIIAEGSDLGFRLWDVARRRQPSRPPRPAEPKIEDGAIPGPP